MKNLIILIFVFLNLWSYAQDKRVNSKIESVTVFQNGAQIHRTANTKLNSGHQIISFSNLSTSINTSSIQVKGKGNFTIMSVTSQINYMKEINNNKRIVALEDSIFSISNKIKNSEQIIAAYSQEIKLLEANRSLKGSNSTVSINEIKQAAEYYRQRFRQIYLDKQKINIKISNYKIKLNKLQQSLNQLRKPKAAKGVGEILVEIDCKQAVSASFTFDYLVNNAGWTPLYDIRAINTDKDIELHYRANIYQNTGVDWNKVKLSVSTGNPHQNGIIPNLNVWYLQYVASRNPRLAQSDSYEDKESVRDMPSRAQRIKGNNISALNSANFTTVDQGQTNTSFHISLPYTIPSSNKTINVKVQKWTLPATYRYYAVPRLDPDAFLQARITGWEDLSLLAGAVNIFFEGTYVGKSYLNPANILDTLDISLGKDKNIVIKRKKVKDKTSNGVFGGDKKMKMAWDISIRNNKKTPIHIVIKDQIPLSRNSNVEVKLLENSNANYDEKTGFLSWDFELESKKVKQLGFQYQVKYPKDINIYNLW